MDLKIIRSNLGKFLFLPQRVIVGVFAFLAIVNAFTLRHSLDLTMTASNSDNNRFQDEKPVILRHLKQRLKFSFHGDNNLYQEKWKLRKRKWIEKTYNQNLNLFLQDLTPSQRHLVLSLTFYVGYIVSHIPGGLLADRYGGKRVLAVALLLSTFLTLITPFTIKRCDVNGLMVLRFLMGLSQGPLFPAVSQLMSQWIPPNERGTLLPIVLSSGQLGILLVNLLFGFLVTSFEWCFIYYFIAAGTILWLICFILFCYDTPKSNPYINEEELLYLQQTVPSLSNLQSTESLTRPWHQMLINPPLWALVVATIQHDGSQSLLLNELHNIVKDLKSFNFWSWLSVFLPLLLNWLISLLAGLISDILIQREILNTTEARQLMTLIAAFGPKICSNFANCILCNESYDLNNFFNCAVGLMGSYYAGIKLTALDLSPSYVGTLMAIANGLGSLGSISAYYLENVVKKSETLQTLHSFLWFIITMFTSGEIQDFDRNVFEINNKLN